VDPTTLARMVKAIAHRGSDGEGQWHEGPIGLGHRLLYTTPESLHEKQPVIDDTGDVRLVWDGRLDNRQELTVTLGADMAPGAGATDPALVLRAYRRWGLRALDHMVGEFAFALWDDRVQTLVCARDRLGLKPLHYTWAGPTLFFGSEIKPLLAARGAIPEPDDEMVLAFLLREFRERDHDRTFFRGMCRLPPGHVLTVRNGVARVGRYWAIDPLRETRYARDDEYVDHFLTLFAEAVRCRLRSEFPIGVFVSGGLDSSAILCTAERYGGGPDGGVPALEAFTLFSDDPASDERTFARDVVAATGRKGHEIHAADDDPLHRIDELLWEVESPIVGAARQSVLAGTDAVLAWGCRVLLSGDGGDHLLDEVGYLADLVHELRLRRFLHDTRAFASWYGGSRAQFAGMALALLVPPRMKYVAKRALRRAPPPWINGGLARAVGLRDRLREPWHTVPFPSFAQADSYLCVASAYQVLKLEVDERASAAAGVETRFPFLDARLVEYVLSVPSTRRTHGGERKRLLRSAMRGIVPDTIRFRRGKGDWTDTMDRSLTALCRRDPPAALENRSGRLGRYVDLRSARRLVDRYVAGQKELRWEVWFLVTVDRWLERFWGRTT
jgi:asparagine synthase (glutamine-hydrolysing)